MIEKEELRKILKDVKPKTPTNRSPLAFVRQPITQDFGKLTKDSDPVDVPPERKPEYFDFLTDAGRKADPATIWWYNLDMVWDDSKSFFERQQSTKKYRLVHKLRRDSGYTFQFVDEPGTWYHCNYTWAFIERTPLNRVIYPIFRFFSWIVRWLDDKRRDMYQHFDTLKVAKPDKNQPSES